jgi:hypothetical protein
MRSVLVITRYYPPDASPCSYRLRHVVEVLTADHEVTVLASQPNRYSGIDPAPAEERQGTLLIRRIWNGQLTTARAKLGRALSEVLGAFWMTAIALISFRKVDLALMSAPPVLYMLPVWALNKLFGVPFVLDVRDLWLDWAEETRLIAWRSLATSP